ncbi:hypothetical protein J4P02_27820 [Pseudomonas sp. NFXW11]|uniref:hypothetical protein n=1 Tax=Pseudomonas sp. NFXW11 TaxID=2819531 RepID=UPI003CEB6AF5
MKRHLLPLLFGLGLCTALQAAPSAEAEAAFQNALHMNEDNLQRLEQLLEQEQQSADRQVLVEAMQQAAQKAEVYENQLRKASDGGHGVASYLLANIEEGRKTLPGHDYSAQHNKACTLYQSAADQGLLAAAVLQLRDCETAFQRFKFDDPELLRLQAQLLKALERPDPYAEHYPLPALNSFCFKPWKMPEVDRKRPLATLKELYTPVQLSLQQFRADAYYLLAIKGDVEKPAARGYFQKARDQAPDCLDPISLGSLFDAMEKKAP